MSQEFQREDRYIVIKRSDLQQAEHHARIAFHSANHNLRESMSKNGVPDRQFVVIESDWPEYEPAWAMIEARMSGAPVPPAGGEVEVLAWRRFYTSHTESSDLPYEVTDFHDNHEFGEKNGDTPLVDRAHVTRLQAENAALQQKLTKANLSCHDLAHKLADKWGSVQGAQFETVKALRYLNEELQQRLSIADQRVDDASDLLQRAQQLIPDLQYNWHANTKALLDSMKLAQ